MGGATGRVLLVGLLAATALVSCGDDGTADDADGAPERVVAILRAVPSTDPDDQARLVAELAAAGFVEGENLRIWGADPTEAYADPEHASAALRRWHQEGPLDLVVALSSSGAQVASGTLADVPVLFLSNDPVAAGLVRDERRPEGNLTGATFRVPADRTLDLVRRLLPDAPRVGILYPEDDPASEPVLARAILAAEQLGLELLTEPFAGDSDVPRSIDRLLDGGAGVIVLANAPATVRSFPAIEEALATRPVATVASTTAPFALLVLRPDTHELYRQMGRQAVRLLQGVPVAEVPVEDPAGFELVLNARLATELGIELPADLMEAADTVIR